MNRSDCQIVVEAVNEATRIMRLHAALRCRKHADLLIDELFQTLDLLQLREALHRLEARDRFAIVDGGRSSLRARSSIANNDSSGSK